jgi:dienelactone hydrolase
MDSRSHLFLYLAGLFLSCHLPNTHSQLASADLRSEEVRTLNTPRDFPEIKNSSHWRALAQQIREQILFSAGLWPMPEKTPLNARIFDRIDRDGYTIEKVYFNALPGFYVAGNLYRPKGKGSGPFPAILNPHGHWSNGRMVDDINGSIAARCIQFARMGMIALNYDMVGYNDTQFADTHLKAAKKPVDFYATHNAFANDRTNLLWNVHLMGLQTWNGIRAVDFLETLSEVDPKRLGCTGESGGGTQTFLLGAIDDRIVVQGPMVMVSHTMQGGCLCENMPGLRIDFSNMELAAAFAPKPQIMIGATGDWTRANEFVEGPAIQKVYRLLKAENKYFCRVLDFGHNYNQATREQVYRFFAEHLLGSTATFINESAYSKEPDSDLRVFPETLPKDAKTGIEVASYLVRQAESQWKKLEQAADGAYRKHAFPAWKRGLQLDLESRILTEKISEQKISNGVSIKWAVGRDGRKDRIPAREFPGSGKSKLIFILASEEGSKTFFDEDSGLLGAAKSLSESGHGVILPDLFGLGELAHDAAHSKRKHLEEHFSGYNRTDAQHRVQDLITLARWQKDQNPKSKIIFHGVGAGAFYAMLASPLSDGVVANFPKLKGTLEQTLLEKPYFIPGYFRFGGVDGALLLSKSLPVLANANHSNWGFEKSGGINLTVMDQEFFDRSLETWLQKINGERK